MFKEYSALIRKIARQTISAQTVWNFPHENPDGDSIGCALAIHLALKSVRREVRTFFSEPVPHTYTFLPGTEEIEFTERLPDELPDLIFVSDNATYDRLGSVFVAELERLGVYSAKDKRHQNGRSILINIDHHPANELYGDLNLVIPDAAAVGEIIYAIFRRLRLPLPPEAATCLYAAILTDTGKFTYSNVTLRTLEIAAQLVQAGAVPHLIADHIYHTQSPGQLRLLGRVLDTLAINDDLGYYYSYVTPQMIEEFNCDPADSEYIVDTLKTLEKPDVCLLFKVVGEGLVKISVRSRGGFDSSKLAEMFGGGGHFAASGFRFRGTLEEAISAVELAMKELREEPAEAKAD